MLANISRKVAYMKTPGQRIKDERLLRGWSQQKLADEIGRIKKEKISRAAVALWESGDSKSQKPENLFAAAESLGLVPKWVLSGTGYQYQREIEENEENNRKIFDQSTDSVLSFDVSLSAQSGQRPAPALPNLAAPLDGINPGDVRQFPERRREDHPAIAKVVALMLEMSDDGKLVLIGRAQEVLSQWPKPNPVESSQ